jgi:peptidoglycan/xylan/chitin deacetylase (PgdA/CDA1 family)
MYHDVVPRGRPEASGFAGASADHYKLNREAFRAHLDALAESAARGAVARVDQADLTVRPWPVFLTFDDGGVSAHDPVAAWLEERGWRGHFFVTTDWIGKPGFLDVARVRDLHARGHVIGSHSCSHPTRMSACPPVQLQREWRDSAARLGEITGEPVRVASVPGGYYSKKVAETAGEAGIRFLFTSEPTPIPQAVGDCLVLGRYVVASRTPTAEVVELATGAARPRLRQAAVWTVKKAAKTVGGPVYVTVGRLLRRRRSEPSR